MAKREANASHAKKRIVFLGHVEPGYGLVTTNVRGADDQLPGSQRGDDFLQGTNLFVNRGLHLAGFKHELCSKQAHTLTAVIENRLGFFRLRDVAHDFDFMIISRYGSLEFLCVLYLLYPVPGIDTTFGLSNGVSSGETMKEDD